jgi:hypothetical protein
VLQNEKYIEFSDENSVEVVAMGRFDEAYNKGAARNADEMRKTAEYDATDENGKPVKYLVEFPGWTKEDLYAVARSKASSYNDTGGIPFVCIVDPHTEKEMMRFPSSPAAGALMDEVKVQKKALNAQHGPSISRGVIAKNDAETKRILDAMPKAGAAKSLADYRKLEKGLEKQPEAVRNRVKPTLEKILEAATKDLDDAEAKLAGSDAPGAKKILDRYGKTLDGTELELRYKELVGKCKAESAPAK